MAHPIITTIKEIKKIDKEKVLRPSYGTTSLMPFEDKLNEVLSKVEFIEKFYDLVDTQTNNEVDGLLQQLSGQINSLVSYNEAQFVAHKETAKAQILGTYNQIKKYSPSYVCAALESSGLLNSVDLQKEFAGVTEKLKTSTEEALKKIGEESSAIILQAQKKATEIESSVRKTAQKISVKEAQDQFGDATAYNTFQIKVWGGISIVLCLAFIAIVIFLFYVDVSKESNREIIYHTVLRLSILTLVGTFLALSLKMLKAHLHMKQRNLHRKRLSNSIASFVESATTKEQGDAILVHLVESVASFGNSGIIGRDEDVSKITIDNIAKTMSSVKG